MAFIPRQKIGAFGIIRGKFQFFLEPFHVVAEMDQKLFGGFRARLEGKFDEAVFVSGFFVNMILAGVLAYLGDKLNVDIYLAVTVALGIRVFNNLGRIRGLLVTHREAARQTSDASQ